MLQAHSRSPDVRRRVNETGFSCWARGSVVVLGSRHRMDAAFRLGPAAPATRALVLASPRFYPHLSERARDAILHLAERALEGPRFEPGWAEVPFAEAAW